MSATPNISGITTSARFTRSLRLFADLLEAYCSPPSETAQVRYSTHSKPPDRPLSGGHPAFAGHLAKAPPDARGNALRRSA